MTLRVRVPSEGRFVKARFSRPGDVDTGKPILYTTEEWLRRRGKANIGFFKFVWLVCAPFIFIMWFTFEYVLDVVAIPYASSLALLYAITLAGVFTALEMGCRMRERRTGLFTGLYEKGLMLRSVMNGVLIFLPYGEIGRFETKRAWTGEQVLIHLRSFERPIMVDLLPTILGEEGLRTLADILERGPDAHGPPKLVLYGSPSP